MTPAETPSADASAIPRSAVIALAFAAFGSGVSLRVTDPLLPRLALERAQGQMDQADIKMLLRFRSLTNAGLRELGEQPVHSFLRMGQWIGGDRDGNPNVNAQTLEYALRRQCEVALRHYLTEVHYLGGELSVSAMLVDCSAEMQALA